MKKPAKTVPQKETEEVCGIIMPISSIADYKESHWLDVRKILHDAIEDVGYSPKLVSLSDEAGVIHKNIVQNLYENPIVVCDVSAKNANVMLELGIRLAFNKPVIIVKDSKTSYSFDTSPIEHLTYPTDLRFPSVVDFKKRLGEKILATIASYTDDPKKNSFLGAFGDFQSVKIDSEEISSADAILQNLEEMKRELRQTRNFSAHPDTKFRMKIPAAAAFKKIYDSIEDYVQTVGIDTTFELVERIDEVLEFVETDIQSPQIFYTRKEFLRLFNEVIDSYNI